MAAQRLTDVCGDSRCAKPAGARLTRGFAPAVSSVVQNLGFERPDGRQHDVGRKLPSDND